MKLLPDANPSADELLSIYLQDHLTGATGGVELFKRAANSQQNPERRAALTRLTTEASRDRDSLLQVMHRLGVESVPHRVVMGWAAEKVGRLKPNGTLLRRSPLSDVIELEALCLGVQGKAAGWRLLEQLALDDHRLDAAALDLLVRRSDAQFCELDEMRLSAGQVLND